jgi:hypothetical protein
MHTRSRAGASTLAKKIAALFAAGKPGAWYDPSDLASLFQDSAGTIPVTAVGQPVGLMRDKSGRGNHASQAIAINRPLLNQDANGKYCLAFNGTTSCMATGNFDLSATDKVTLLAGVKKSNDTAAIIMELGVNVALTAGSFYLVSGNDLGVTGYTSIGRGDAASSAALASKIATFPAPDTAVVSIQHDIAGDLSTSRRNGIDYGTGAGDKGLGNFAAGMPLYIGARAGASVFFTGNIYGLIVCGALSNASEVATLEGYMNGKTSAF